MKASPSAATSVPMWLASASSVSEWLSTLPAISTTVNVAVNPRTIAILRGTALPLLTFWDMSIGFGLIIVLGLVAANAFFVAAEFALVSAPKTRPAEMARGRDRKARLG